MFHDGMPGVIDLWPQQTIDAFPEIVAFVGCKSHACELGPFAARANDVLREGAAFMKIRPRDARQLIAPKIVGRWVNGWMDHAPYSLSNGWRP